MQSAPDHSSLFKAQVHSGVHKGLLGEVSGKVPYNKEGTLEMYHVPVTGVSIAEELGELASPTPSKENTGSVMFAV